jgi:hypothetical protein
MLISGIKQKAQDTIVKITKREGGKINNVRDLHDSFFWKYVLHPSSLFHSRLYDYDVVRSNTVKMD